MEGPADPIQPALRMYGFFTSTVLGLGILNNLFCLQGNSDYADGFMFFLLSAWLLAAVIGAFRFRSNKRALATSILFIAYAACEISLYFIEHLPFSRQHRMISIAAAIACLVVSVPLLWVKKQ